LRTSRLSEELDMQISEVMTPKPIACAADTTVAEAARLMWDGDCGVLPVVADRQLRGVVTDRDLFIALATRNARPSELTVASVVRPNPITCLPRDDVHQAMGKMKTHRVRRLPVVDDGGALVGIVSMNDLVLAIAPETRLGGQVVDTLQTISEHQLPMPTAKQPSM
jgi:CBS domain-containing protein